MKWEMQLNFRVWHCSSVVSKRVHLKPTDKYLLYGGDKGFEAYLIESIRFSFGFRIANAEPFILCSN